MFDFAERFNKLALTDDEIALFSAVVLLSPGIYTSVLNDRRRERTDLHRHKLASEVTEES